MTKENEKNNVKLIKEFIWNCKFLLALISILIIVILILITSNYYEKTYIVDFNGEDFKNMYEIAFNNLTNWLTGLGILLTIVVFVFGFITYDYSDKIERIVKDKFKEQNGKLKEEITKLEDIEKKIDTRIKEQDKKIDTNIDEKYDKLKQEIYEKYEEFSKEVKNSQNANFSYYIDLIPEDSKEQIDTKISKIKLLIKQEKENQFNLIKLADAYGRLAVLDYVNFEENIEKSEKIYKKLIDENIAKDENLIIAYNVLVLIYVNKYNILKNLDDFKKGMEYGYKGLELKLENKNRISILNGMVNLLNSCYYVAWVDEKNKQVKNTTIVDSNQIDNFKKIELKNKKFDKKEDLFEEYKKLNEETLKLDSHQVDANNSKSIIIYYEDPKNKEKIKKAILYLKKAIKYGIEQKKDVKQYYHYLKTFYVELNYLEENNDLKIEYLEEAINYKMLYLEDRPFMNKDELDEIVQFYIYIANLKFWEYGKSKDLYLQEVSKKYFTKYQLNNKKNYLNLHYRLSGLINIEQFNNIDTLKVAINTQLSNIENIENNKENIYIAKLMILDGLLKNYAKNDITNFLTNYYNSFPNFIFDKIVEISSKAIIFNKFYYWFYLIKADANYTMAKLNLNGDDKDALAKYQEAERLYKEGKIYYLEYYADDLDMVNTLNKIQVNLESIEIKIAKISKKLEGKN